MSSISILAKLDGMSSEQVPLSSGNLNMSLVNNKMQLAKEHKNTGKLYVINI